MKHEHVNNAMRVLNNTTLGAQAQEINSTHYKHPVIATLTEHILYLTNNENSPVLDTVKNQMIAIYFGKVKDACLYELYFEDEIKSAQVDVLELVEQAQDRVSSLPIEQQIRCLFEEWTEYKNEVRNRIILQEIRCESVINARQGWVN